MTHDDPTLLARFDALGRFLAAASPHAMAHPPMTAALAAAATLIERATARLGLRGAGETGPGSDGSPPNGLPPNAFRSNALQRDGDRLRGGGLGGVVLCAGDVAGDGPLSCVDLGSGGVPRDGGAVGRGGGVEYTVVALAGASGGGKSSLFNALAGMELSRPGHLRPTTAEAYACVWGGDGAGALLDWLEVGPSRRFVRESALDADDEASLRGLVLLDLPDVDSIVSRHRAEADRLVGVVDLVIWVLDPQKYADQTVHDDYLRRMGALRDVTVVVFNQVDRLTAADAARCRADLGRLVAADGLAGIPIVATSTTTGEGVGELRVLLEKTVAGPHAALTRLGGELAVTIDALAPLVSPVALTDIPVDAVEVLARDLAAAAGVAAVGGEAIRRYRQRAALTGWPFHTRTATAEIPPAERSAVGLALRRLADRVGSGLPAPWPDQVVTAATTDLERLPYDLRRCLTLARPPMPGAAGWWLARALWWSVIGVAIVSTGWVLSAGLDNLPDLVPGNARIPLLVLGGSLLAAVVLPPCLRPLAAVRARRFGGHTESSLRAAVATLAAGAVAPVGAVLRDHATARTALAEARPRPTAAIPPQR
jgi:GTP-binding protein EngB required for normal cell division